MVIKLVYTCVLHELFFCCCGCRLQGGSDRSASLGPWSLHVWLRRQVARFPRHQPQSVFPLLFNHGVTSASVCQAELVKSVSHMWHDLCHMWNMCVLSMWHLLCHACDIFMRHVCMKRVRCLCSVGWRAGTDQVPDVVSSSLLLQARRATAVQVSFTAHSVHSALVLMKLLIVCWTLFHCRRVEHSLESVFDSSVREFFP